jgi:hypothetical protein
MRIRTSVAVLICAVCCAGLAACTAAASSGPDVTVTDPSVGRPAPPDSVQAALSRMAFTPYAALGQSSNDGLAPNESTNTLSEECMSAAGYPNTDVGPFSVRVSEAGLAFSQNWGSWGYVGLADAEQWGFLQPAGSGLSSLGIDAPSPTNPASLPAAEQTAMLKCSNIVADFTNTINNGPLAGIQTLTNDMYNDVLADGQIKSATKAWSDCMAKNGYSYPNPMTAFRDELQSISGGSGAGIKINVGGSSLTPAQNQAQIAMAVTDANCTQSTDLAGIYFAVEASYEQQIVNANQQALSAAVQQFRADYQKEVGKLPQLLKTAKAAPYTLPIRRGTTKGVVTQGSASVKP